jgi:hypothetical protein
MTHQLSDLLRRLELLLVEPAGANEVLWFERRFVLAAEETPGGGRRFVLEQQDYSEPVTGTIVGEVTLDAAALDAARADRAPRS